jgi:hypothetical protein
MSILLLSLLLGLPLIAARWGVDSRQVDDRRVIAEIHAMASKQQTTLLGDIGPTPERFHRISRFSQSHFDWGPIAGRDNALHDTTGWGFFAESDRKSVSP